MSLTGSYVELAGGEEKHIRGELLRGLKKERDVGRTRTSVSRSEPSELTLQRVDLCKVAARVVVAALLAASYSEAPARVSVTSTVLAQVDDLREVLPLLQRGGRYAVTGRRSRSKPASRTTMTDTALPGWASTPRTTTTMGSQT
jgi:hypothetical protein